MADFPKGLFVKKPHQNAPSFVKAKVSVKKEDFIKYIAECPDEYLNFDVKESKDGKLYIERDTWKPKPSDLQQGEQSPKMPENTQNEPNDEDIPF